MARVIGFEGIKVLNRQLNIQRKKIMQDRYTELKLIELFPDQVDQRLKDQSDLLIELCKFDFS